MGLLGTGGSGAGIQTVFGNATSKQVICICGFAILMMGEEELIKWLRETKVP